MPSGWKKIGSGQRIRYDNKTSPISIIVDEDDIKGGWRVVKFGSHNNEIIKRTKTKPEAMKFAIKYMREHPRG